MEVTQSTLSPPTLGAPILEADQGSGELKTKKLSPGEYPAEFREFWSAYPHPPEDDKARAYRNYKKLRKKLSAAELLTIAHNYAAVRKGKDTQYNKKAANFLGMDETWRDYQLARPASLPTHGRQGNTYQSNSVFAPTGADPMVLPKGG